MGDYVNNMNSKSNLRSSSVRQNKVTYISLPSITKTKTLTKIYDSNTARSVEKLKEVIV